MQTPVLRSVAESLETPRLLLRCARPGDAASEFWYLMMDQQHGSCAGVINLHSIQWNVPKFEIGFWCRKSRQGEGLACEAVRGLAKFALEALGAKRLEALPDEENAAGRRVCEQAGYVLEGIRRHDRIEPGGALRSSCMYALVR